MVFMPFCYAEAAGNLLTNPAHDPLGKIPEFKSCAVKAECRELQRGQKQPDVGFLRFCPSQLNQTAIRLVL
jgi:predicted molibdopterin-dependent oxidoreductase YjgC